LRIKWDVHLRPDPLPTIALSAVALGPTPPAMVEASLPNDLPMPDVWLDPGAVSTIFANPSANQLASSYQNVQLLRDRGQRGCHCSFAPGVAVWANGPIHRVNGSPVLMISGGVGTFQTSPLNGWSTNSGFSIVACYRYIDGAHPMSVSTQSVLSATTWEEYIGSENGRSMPAMTSLVENDIVIVYWRYHPASNVLSCMLRSSSGYAQHWSRIETPLWTPSSAIVTVGSTSKKLHLGELLVWQTTERETGSCMHPPCSRVD
jgi:hypothetical protein